MIGTYYFILFDFLFVSRNIQGGLFFVSLFVIKNIYVPLIPWIRSVFSFSSSRRCSFSRFLSFLGYSNFKIGSEALSFSNRYKVSQFHRVQGIHSNFAFDFSNNADYFDDKNVLNSSIIFSLQLGYTFFCSSFSCNFQ